ncbi:hypothetical protein CEXT_484181 [Caerostris extrusa]|uniref:Uncharacterized protein n=1 Tax=Caerostris extrusa TaxID=172846 RepID=A0AAV4NT18_CAEEX|nr:hypothetical protein CEXT_484181 [Caerostris extrusa]
MICSCISDTGHLCNAKDTGRLYVVDGVMQQDQCKHVLHNKRDIPMSSSCSTYVCYAIWSRLSYNRTVKAFYKKQSLYYLILEIHLI